MALPGDMPRKPVDLSTTPLIYSSFEQEVDEWTSDDRAAPGGVVTAGVTAGGPGRRDRLRLQLPTGHRERPGRSVAESLARRQPSSSDGESSLHLH